MPTFYTQNEKKGETSYSLLCRRIPSTIHNLFSKERRYIMQNHPATFSLLIHMIQYYPPHIAECGDITNISQST